MKKRIVLFLAAALVSAGLIMSCGGGGGGSDDDDTQAPGGPGTTGPYTITFDTDGGTPATIAPIEVEAGRRPLGDWPANPTRGDDTFLGWYDASGTAWTSSSTINSNLALKAKWQVFVWPAPLLDFDSFTPLGEFTWLNLPNQRGWTFGAEYNDYTFTDDTWLVLEIKNGNMGGFGGVQLTFINDYEYDGDDDPATTFKKYEKELKGGWDSYDKEQDEVIYFAISLAAHEKYDDFRSEVTADFFNLYIASYPWANLGFQNAYLTEEKLDRISTGKIMDLAAGGVTYGFIISAEDIDWEDLSNDSFVSVTGLTYTGPVVGFVDEPITLSATVAPSNATKKTIAWTTTTTGATITAGGKLTSTTAGKVTVTATITDAVTSDGTTFTDFTETFTDVVEFVVLPTIENAVAIDNDGTGQWGSINEITPFPEYFIVATVGGGSATGFNGVQFALNGAGVSNVIRTTGNFTSLAHEATDVVYFVINLKGWDEYDTWKSATWAQFRINYGHAVLGTYLGFYVDASAVTSGLTKPSEAVQFALQASEGVLIDGYATKVLPAELQTGP